MARSTHAPEPAAIVPRSIRYQLTAAQAAAALHLAGLEPDGTLLTSPGGVTDPRPVLRDAQLLAPDGDLPPFLAETLAVAADPGRVLQAVASVPGAPDWVDLRIGAAASGGPYVTVHQSDDAVDLFALETPMEVAAVLDDLFRFTSYPTRPVDPDVALTLPAWLGLLAVADLRRAARLRAELDRRQTELGAFTVDQLEDAVAAGLAGTDTRWAVTQAIPLAPAPLRTRRPDAATMVEQMTTLGLVREAPDGLRSTELATGLIELVETALVVGSLTLTYERPQRPVRGGELLVYRTPARLAVGIWSGTAESPVLTITEPVGEAAVAMVERMAELPDRHPEAEVPAPPPAPPAPPPPGPPPAVAFVATHHVPLGGLPRRDVPDATTSPSSSIPAATGLRLVETAGAWARVESAQGELGWVDRRRLVDGPPPPPWQPTQVVGAGGVRTRPSPDPGVPPSGALAPDTPVELLERRGDWARVSTSTGEIAWIDGRRLHES